MSCIHIWRQLKTQLAQWYRVTAAQIAGRGKSGATRKTREYPQNVQQISASSGNHVIRRSIYVVSLPKRQAAQQRLWPVEGLRLFEVLERINASSQSKPLEATEEDWGAGEGGWGERADVRNTSPLGHAFYTVRCEAVSHTGGLAQVYQPPDLSPWGWRHIRAGTETINLDKKRACDHPMK